MLVRIADKPYNTLAAPIATVQLNFDWPARWEENVRGVPNVVLRSALFSVVRKGCRCSVEWQNIVVQKGYSIAFNGEIFDQYDLGVWQTVLHVCRNQRIGDTCRISGRTLLALLGLTDSGSNYIILEKSLTRLCASTLKLKVIDKYNYTGHLIDDFAKCEQTKLYSIRLNPKLSALFDSDEFTKIDWEVRKKLNGKQLAQWLHGYYATHAQPYDLKIETLKNLCGCASTTIEFKKLLKQALFAVAEITKKSGGQFSFCFVGDLVQVKKSGSASQQNAVKKIAIQRNAKTVQKFTNLTQMQPALFN